MNRRIKSRIDVQLTCYVGAGKVKGAPLRAITENISRTGVLMRWVEGIPLPDIDGKLVLDLQLPENSEVGPRLMRCRTEVVRVSRGQENTHEVALRILSMRVINSKHSHGTRDLASMPLATDHVS